MSATAYASQGHSHAFQAYNGNFNWVLYEVIFFRSFKSWQSINKIETKTP